MSTSINQEELKIREGSNFFSISKELFPSKTEPNIVSYLSPLSLVKTDTKKSRKLSNRLKAFISEYSELRQSFFSSCKSKGSKIVLEDETKSYLSTQSFCKDIDINSDDMNIQENSNYQESEKFVSGIEESLNIGMIEFKLTDSDVNEYCDNMRNSKKIQESLIQTDNVIEETGKQKTNVTSLDEICDEDKSTKEHTTLNFQKQSTSVNLFTRDTILRQRSRPILRTLNTFPIIKEDDFNLERHFDSLPLTNTKYFNEEDDGNLLESVLDTVQACTKDYLKSLFMVDAQSCSKLKSMNVDNSEYEFLGRPKQEQSIMIMENLLEEAKETIIEEDVQEKVSTLQEEIQKIGLLLKNATKANTELHRKTIQREKLMKVNKGFGNRISKLLWQFTRKVEEITMGNAMGNAMDSKISAFTY